MKGASIGGTQRTPSVDQARRVIDAALSEGRAALSEHEAKQVLAAYGVPVTAERLARDTGELAVALGELGFPVVLKIDSPDILHKTEAGLIALGCATAGEAEVAFREILGRAREQFPDAILGGVLVQEMVTGSVAECIVGMKKDPQFGPAILFGLGGIFVEVLGDVALRLAPLTAADATAMIEEIKGYRLLAGARGRAKADLTAIEDVLLRMSRLALDLEEYFTEIDINPLMVAPQGAGHKATKAADALFLLERRPADAPLPAVL